MVSIREIARLCGVTEGTVSRALSGNGKVSEKTRGKVLAAAKKFNYNPNALVRGVFTGKTRTVGMTVYPVPDEFNMQLINGALTELCAHDYRLMLMPWPDFFPEASHIVKKFNEYRVDGILITPIIQRDFNEYRLELEKYYGKVVVIDQQLPSARFDFVGFDDRAGTAEAVSLFLKTGRKRFGWVCGGFCVSAESRFQTYLSALESAGVERKDRLMLNLPVETPLSEFKRRTAEMLKTESPDAVLAFNDFDAVQLLSVAVDLGLKVPEDLAIIGYGDLLIGRLARPAITTIAQDACLMGRTAADQLLRRIASGTEQFLPEKRLLEAHLEVRGSV